MSAILQVTVAILYLAAFCAVFGMAAATHGRHTTAGRFGLKMMTFAGYVWLGGVALLFTGMIAFAAGLVS